MNGFPEFPPGFWRRILLQPGPGWIGGALEDDMHCFHLRLEHDGARVTKVAARAVRHPWTGCAGAPAHLAGKLTDAALADVARRDATLECTHLFDLAILCAAHAGDIAPSRFDMRVADRVDGCTTATLVQDGEERLRWRIDQTVIAGPDPFTGLDIKRLSQWKHDFPADVAEQATMLRRAVFVSGARQYPTPVNVTAGQQGALRQGVCFNYQPEQAASSTPLFERREFSQSGQEPLGGFDAPLALSALS